MSYWDTSCLVKLYVVEPDSPIFRQHVQARGEAVVTGEFARLEFMVTVRRKEAVGEIAVGAAEQHLAHLDLEIQGGVCLLTAVDENVRVQFEDVIKRCYSQTPPIYLRTLDALHVAAARVAGETEIVATDRRLREAAALLGFQLFPAPAP